MAFYVYFLFSNLSFSINEDPQYIHGVCAALGESGTFRWSAIIPYRAPIHVYVVLPVMLCNCVVYVSGLNDKYILAHIFQAFSLVCVLENSII